MDQAPVRMAASKDVLHFLRECLGISGTTCDESNDHSVMFFAIDFENSTGLQSSKEDVSGQLGVAMLDSKHLSAPPQKGLMSAHSFALGLADYVTRAKSASLFSRTKEITRESLADALEAILPRSRRLVLVGHAIQNDLAVLQHLNFDLYTSIIGILDTQSIARQFWGNTKHITLAALLERLDCPYMHLHHAGNDANFTLRCLLLLAAHEYDENCSPLVLPGLQKRKQRLRGIAEHGTCRDWSLRRYRGSMMEAEARIWNIGTHQLNQERVRWDTKILSLLWDEHVLLNE